MANGHDERQLDDDLTSSEGKNKAHAKITVDSESRRFVIRKQEIRRKCMVNRIGRTNENNTM